MFIRVKRSEREEDIVHSYVNLIHNALAFPSSNNSIFSKELFTLQKKVLFLFFS